MKQADAKKITGFGGFVPSRESRGRASREAAKGAKASSKLNSIAVDYLKYCDDLFGQKKNRNAK